MTAHVVFSAIDPLAPATTSATMVREVIRGFIGFKGLLMSDDIAMGALSGTPAERTRAAFMAGCDVVLHCNGKLDEMREVAAESPRLAGRSAARAVAALAMREEPAAFDPSEGRKTFASLLAGDRLVAAARPVFAQRVRVLRKVAQHRARPLARRRRRHR
jgi:beta-N-acetylhexosaminidase